MKKNKIVTLLLLLLVMTMVLGSFAASAQEPYQTYTYSSDGFALYSPSAYTPIRSVGFLDIPNAPANFVNFSAPTDIEVDKDGNVYIADPTNNRIVVLEGVNYSYKFELNLFNNNGYNDSLKGCAGVFVNDDFIYVCDTAKARIVIFDKEGSFVRTIEKPYGTLFGTDTAYKPVAMAVDQYGKIYVVSSETSEGVIVMTSDGLFTGFIGAQNAAYNILDIIWRRFQTEEQRNSQVQNLSKPFNNITIDEEGFIYVTSNSYVDGGEQQGSIDNNSADFAAVKKLNSNGDEVMKRNGFFGPGGEVDIQSFSTNLNAPLGSSNIVDVAIGDEGTWSIADFKRSKIFTYDQNGVLLYAFGDKGIQLGNMQEISALTYQDGKLLVLDKKANTFTVYKRTQYGDLLVAAIACENNRMYTAAVSAWLDVLRFNNNFDSAYIGVGKAYARQGDATFVSVDGQSYYKESDVAVYENNEVVKYTVNGKADGEVLNINRDYDKTGYELSMEYLSAAYDDENWSDSYKEIRKDWLSDWFLLLPLAIILVVVGLSFLFKFAGKYNAKVALLGVGRKTYAQELMYVFHLIFHPFDGFWDLKHERRGSVRAALTILGLVIVGFYYQSIGTGYVMNPMGEYSTIFAQILSVGLPFVLWVIANWCLTTLFDGEGSFKDVFIASSYALAPLPFLLIVSTILSNVVTFEEAAIVSMISVAGYVWALLLLFFGTMVTHGYSFGKNFITCLGTIVGMAIIMFVGFLFSSLVGKMLTFVTSIVTEISYRV